jgi:hypothetical protein
MSAYTVFATFSFMESPYYNEEAVLAPLQQRGELMVIDHYKPHYGEQVWQGRTVYCHTEDAVKACEKLQAVARRRNEPESVDSILALEESREPGQQTCWDNMVAAWNKAYNCGADMCKSTFAYAWFLACGFTDETATYMANRFEEGGK